MTMPLESSFEKMTDSKASQTLSAENEKWSAYTWKWESFGFINRNIFGSISKITQLN